MLQQDPQKIRHVELLSAGSIIGEALFNPNNGIMKRNAKKDKAFNKEVDGLIYQTSGEESDRHPRVIENVIVMPMISSKSQVVGVIQIANSEKQNAFTDLDMDIIRLFAAKFGAFIAETREQTI